MTISSPDAPEHPVINIYAEEPPSKSLGAKDIQCKHSPRAVSFPGKLPCLQSKHLAYKTPYSSTGSSSAPLQGSKILSSILYQVFLDEETLNGSFPHWDFRLN